MMMLPKCCTVLLRGILLLTAFTGATTARIYDEAALALDARSSSTAVGIECALVKSLTRYSYRITTRQNFIYSPRSLVISENSNYTVTTRTKRFTSRQSPRLRSYSRSCPNTCTRRVSYSVGHPRYTDRGRRNFSRKTATRMTSGGCVFSGEVQRK